MDKLLAHVFLAALVGVSLSSCTPSPQTSSETHFVTCVVDADCVVLGAGYLCESGVCRLPAAARLHEAGLEASDSRSGGGGGSAGFPGRDASEGGSFLVPTEAGNPGSDRADGGSVDASPDAATRVRGWEGERIVSVGLSAGPTGGLVETGPQRVGVAADGTAFAMFDMSNPVGHIYVNRYVPGAGWAGPVAVDAGTAHASAAYANLAVSANGEAMCVWWAWVSTDGGQTEVLYAARYSGAWGQPIVVAELTGGSAVSSMGADAHGNFVVGWHVSLSSGPSSLNVARFDAAQGWGTPVHVPRLGSGPDVASVAPSPPNIAVDPGGDVVVAWGERHGTSGTTGDAWVRAERWTSAGGWSGAETLSGSFQAMNSIPRSRVALANDGRAVTVWTEQGHPNDAGVLSASRKIMTATFDGTWSSPVQLDAEAIDEAAVGTDSNGHFIAVWGSNTDLYAARLTLGGAWSSPSRITVPVAPLDGGSVAFVRGESILAVSGNGSAIARWERYVPGSSMPAIEAAHFDPVAGWTGPVVITEQAQNEANLAIDADGNGTIAWSSASDAFGWGIRYTPKGGWGAPVHISTGTVGFMTSAIGTSGEVVALWYQGQTVRANVYR